MERQRSRYQSRLLVHLLEDIAKETPDRVYAAVPKGTDVSDGFVDITFEQIARGTDFMCEFLKKTLGPTPAYEFETLTYVGLADLRYSMFLLACVKCGYKAFFPSPRNTDEVNLSLMEQTRSTNLFHSAEMGSLATRLCSISSTERTAVQIPSFWEILESKAKHVPYDVRFEDGLHHPMLVLHSSGSTGTPKPITMKLGYAATYATCRSFRTPPGRISADFTISDFEGRGGRYFAPFPPYHLGGLVVLVISPIYSLSIPVHHPPLRIPNAELFLEVSKHQDLSAATLPPSIVESLVSLPGGLESLKKLEWLAFAGGPLSDSIGPMISKYTILCQFYGSTETAQMNQLVPLPENWKYMEFHPDEIYRMDHIRDNIYELVFLADPRASKDFAGSAAFAYTVGGSEYRSKDLFRKHPHKDLWQFYGRKDDIIVLSSTEKFFPVPTEVSLCANAAISAAVVFGEGRVRPGVLVEPSPGSQQKPDLTEQIWSAVQSTNLKAPGYGRISRNMIIVGNPSKPFVKTGKGTVVRKLTQALYDSEIESLYEKERVGSGQEGNDLTIESDPEKLSIDDLALIVRSVAREVLGEMSFEYTTNLYVRGMDSLNTADIVSRLSRKLGKRRWLTPNLCYTNPSIAELSTAIHSHLKGTHTHRGTDQAAMIRTAVSKFSYPSSARNGLSGLMNGVHVNGHKQSVLKVVVTGTTGTLGTELVHTLLNAYTHCEIVCLNRRPDNRKNWKPSNTQIVSEHVVNFSKPHLGLSSSHATAIQSCDIVIHNAWKVDFNQALSSFEDSLLGLQRLIDLCITATANTSVAATKPPRLVYISSVSAAGSLSTVPEAAIEDLSASLGMGYAQSKLVAEHVLAVAARELRLPVTILRVGQIAGSSDPQGGTPWPAREAFPGLFRTARHLCLVPDGLAPVNWVPIDCVARAVLELSLSSSSTKEQGETDLTYYNLVNPHDTEWRDLLEPLQRYCGPASKVIPLKKWIDVLRGFDRTDKEQLESMPVLKTLEFFEALAEAGDQAVKFETEGAVLHSPSLASLEPISKDSLDMWLRTMDA